MRWWLKRRQETRCAWYYKIPVRNSKTADNHTKLHTVLCSWNLLIIISSQNITLCALLSNSCCFIPYNFTLIYTLFRSLLFCKMIVLNLRDVSFQHALAQWRCLLANLILGSSHCHCCLWVGGRAATMRRQITTSHASPNSSPCSWQLLISLSPKWIWTSFKYKHFQEWLTTASSILSDKHQTPKTSDEPHRCEPKFYDQNENSVSIKHWGINCDYIIAHAKWRRLGKCFPQGKYTLLPNTFIRILHIPLILQFIYCWWKRTSSLTWCGK